MISIRSEKDSAPRIELEKYRLANGLEVILSEDHRLPIVSLNIWYHVGTANERPGRTGFAHLFEHMMFQGSKHVGNSPIKFLEAAGATDINGTTGFDRTNYFETLPSEKLELGLWFESDRMAFLLESLTARNLANQRDVVRNERRQRENAPYHLVFEELYRQLFTEGHPYRAMIMGSHADIESASLEEMRHFCKQYYRPSNASLVLVGDFHSSDVKLLVEKYFASIPAGAAVPKMEIPIPRIESAKRATVTDQVELPCVYKAWLTAPAFLPGDAELDALARILAGGPASRLYQNLIQQKQLAQDLHVGQQSMMLGSVFSIWATPKPGVAIEKLETAIEAELESVRTSGPNLREVERTINRMQSEFVFSVEEVGGMTGIADRLNTYNHYLGDPNYIGRDWDRYAAVTPESVRLAAGTLSAESCVTVLGMPGAKVLADVPKRMDVEVDLPAEEAEGSESWRSDPPRASIQHMAELPVPVRLTLANGLTLLFLEQRHIPALSVSLTVQGGRSANPVDLPGLASFTTKMLARGTVRRSQSQLAAEFEVLGANWSIGSSASASTATLQVLTRRGAAALELFSDLILNPKFDEDEIEKMRRERQVSILQRRDNPGQLAEEQFAAALFGLPHPYGYPETGTEESNQKITRAELERFYSNVFRPNRSALAIVGDLSQSEAKSWAERYFGEWRPKFAATVDLAANQKVGKRIVIVDRPGSPETQLMVGHSGIDRKHSDFLALEVMNGILGGTFSSRINTNLREVHGYTYGTNSHLVYRKGPGLFLISGQVRTDATAASLVQIFGEVERIRTTIAEPEELANAKEAFSRSLISRFNGNAGCASAFSELFLYELDLSHFQRALSQVSSVELSDIRRVAHDHLVPENMLVVAVGDAGTIKSQLNASSAGLEMILSPEDAPVPTLASGCAKAEEQCASENRIGPQSQPQS